ncbi:MAG: IS3 family transposase, partial [Gallicola sp.]|nr:IS3 family transposase [Gallicola sp.]
DPPSWVLSFCPSLSIVSITLYSTIYNLRLYLWSATPKARARNYIHYYNHQRRSQKLNGMTPEEFRNHSVQIIRSN